MIKNIVLLDLFSGIGGFAKGLSDGGFNIEKHYFSEIDKHAIANYKYNFKNAEYVGSVTDVRGSQLERPNIITFGSPCQDFSLAGKRKGMEGQRSSLITEAIRLISECRPDVFIWENVKGTFSSNDGADFWGIIQAFTNIGGYRLEWQLLNTSWFLPQNRERIYLIGHLAGKSEPKVFPFREDDRLFIKSKQSKERRTQTKSSTTLKASGAMKADDTFIEIPLKAGCLTGGGHSGGLHGDMTVIPILTPGRKEKRQNGRRFKEDSFTLTGQDRHGVMITSNTKKGYEEFKEGDSINYSNPNSKTRRGRVGKGKAQTLDTACNQGVLIQKKETKGNPEATRIYETNGISKTLNSGGGGQGAKTGLYDVQTGVRRLTEIECERLQGFPDDWTKYGIYDGKIKEISMSQRYKMCGNSVTTDVVEKIAKLL